jgi:hypothetical protein
MLCLLSGFQNKRLEHAHYFIKNRNLPLKSILK